MGTEAKSAQRRGADEGSAPPAIFARAAFTLIELLTVIAILAVLATLLFTALTGAKRKSRQIRCTANLHQTSLALNMYLDDADRRPPHFTPVVRQKYLGSAEVLLCPEDKSRNWGGLVQGGAFLSRQSKSISAPVEGIELPAGESDEPLPTSYLHSLSWGDEAWKALQQQGGSGGLAACQLHGLGRQNLEAPSLMDFQGLVLRAQRDGAVVRRRVFWEQSVEASFAGASPPPSAPELDAPVEFLDPAWPLLTDQVPKP